MARRTRIWYPGAMYHIMSRGNRRMPIFQEPYDYIAFLEYLKNAMDTFPCTLHSICLMTNHFHFLMETSDTEPGKIMQNLLSRYAMDFNHRYKCNGHLFEGRFASFPVRNDRYFLEVSRYIHLNPVKAQMVQKPGDYAYSSYNLFVIGDEISQENMIGELMSQIVTSSRILSFFGPDSRNQYRAFVEGETSHEEQELQIQNDMRENSLWLP